MENQELGSRVESIKVRIANVQSLPLSEHVAEYDTIHNALEKALSEVESI
jgi:hypothetical protein